MYKRLVCAGASDLGGEHGGDSRQVGAAALPSSHGADRPQGPGDWGPRPQHAVKGDGQREPRSAGRGDAGPGEGGDDADMGVNDVGTQAGHKIIELTSGSWVHGQLTGQTHGGAEDREAVDPFDAATAIVADRCRSDDGGLVTGQPQVAGEIPHLGLDAAQPGRVAVGDDEDAHDVKSATSSFVTSP